MAPSLKSYLLSIHLIYRLANLSAKFSSPSSTFSKDALSLVIPALENLTRSNEVPPMNDPNDRRNVPGYYDYWFRSLESALLGRGKMGSPVGVSEEVRKGSGHDSSLR
jgi:hypothetical protein